MEDKNTGEVSTTYNRTDGPIGTFLPDMGSDPSDNREPRGMYAADTTAALEPFGGRGPVIPDTTAPAPKALTYNEILERALVILAFRREFLLTSARTLSGMMKADN